MTWCGLIMSGNKTPRTRRSWLVAVWFNYFVINTSTKNDILFLIKNVCTAILFVDSLPWNEQQLFWTLIFFCGQNVLMYNRSYTTITRKHSSRMRTTRLSGSRGYDVTSCLVPCSFQGMSSGKEEVGSDLVPEVGGMAQPLWKDRHV